MFATALKKKLSYAQTLQSQRPDHIFLVRGLDSGHSAWYYVMINHGKRDAFLNKSGSPTLTLSDYGHILHSGFGDTPPEHIRTRMEVEYNFTTT